MGYPPRGPGPYLLASATPTTAPATAPSAVSSIGSRPRQHKMACPCNHFEYFTLMFYRAFIIGVFSAITVVLCTTASAQLSAVQGDVRGVDGHPVKGAEIRVERKDKNAPLLTGKTDGRGHYSVSGLTVGLYTISVRDGALGSSTTVGTTQSNARIDFDLKPTTAKRIKHYVWVPARTGSHLGSSWVEVDNSGTPIAGPLNAQSVSGAAMEDMMRNATPGQGDRR